MTSWVGLIKLCLRSNPLVTDNYCRHFSITLSNLRFIINKFSVFSWHKKFQIFLKLFTSILLNRTICLSLVSFRTL